MKTETQKTGTELSIPNDKTEVVYKLPPDLIEAFGDDLLSYSMLAEAANGINRYASYKALISFSLYDGGAAFVAMLNEATKAGDDKAAAYLHNFAKNYICKIGSKYAIDGVTLSFKKGVYALTLRSQASINAEKYRSEFKALLESVKDSSELERLKALPVKSESDALSALNNVTAVIDTARKAAEAAKAEANRVAVIEAAKQAAAAKAAIEQAKAVEKAEASRIAAAAAEEAAALAAEKAAEKAAAAKAAAAAAKKDSNEETEKAAEAAKQAAAAAIDKAKQASIEKAEAAKQEKEAEKELKAAEKAAEKVAEQNRYISRDAIPGKESIEKAEKTLGVLISQGFSDGDLLAVLKAIEAKIYAPRLKSVA